MSCIVKHCKNIKRFKPEGITFHRFPRDKKMLNKWLVILDKNIEHIQHDLNVIKNKSICSRHFRVTDFIRTPTRVFLKPNAVPSILLEEVVKISSCITIHPLTATRTDGKNSEIAIPNQCAPLLTNQTNINNSINQKEKVMIIQRDHSYNTSPEDYKMKYQSLREIHLKTKRKLYNANVKIKNLNKKVLTLQLTVADLRKF